MQRAAASAARSLLDSHDTCRFPCRHYTVVASVAAAVGSAAEVECTEPVEAAALDKAAAPGPYHYYRTWNSADIAGHVAAQPDDAAAAAHTTAVADAADYDSHSHPDQHHRRRTFAALLGRDSPGRAGARLAGMS